MNKISISNEVFARHRASLDVIAGKPRLQAGAPNWRDRPLQVTMVDPDVTSAGDPLPDHLFMPEVQWLQPLPPVLRPIRRVYAGDFAWGTPLMPAMPPVPADAPFMPPEQQLLPPGLVKFATVVLAACVLAGSVAMYFKSFSFL